MPSDEAVKAAREWLEGDWMDDMSDPTYPERAITGLANLLDSFSDRARNRRTDAEAAETR